MWDPHPVWTLQIFTKTLRTPPFLVLPQNLRLSNGWYEMCSPHYHFSKRSKSFEKFKQHQKTNYDALMQRHTTVVPYVQGTKRETKTYKNHQNLVLAVSAWNKQHSYPMLPVCWQWTTAVYNISGWQAFNFEDVHSTESEKQLKSKLHSAYNCFIKYVNIMNI